MTITLNEAVGTILPAEAASWHARGLAQPRCCTLYGTI